MIDNQLEGELYSTATTPPAQLSCLVVNLVTVEPNVKHSVQIHEPVCRDKFNT